jgi:hypothetical protein
MKSWLVSALAVGVLLATHPAKAQDAREQARENFNAGVSAFEAGNFEQALEAFQEAYRLAPHPSVRVNMANCYERLNRPLEALFHYESFLSEATDAPPAQRREVQAAIEELDDRIGEVTLRIAPDGALVRLDESEVRRAPIMNTIRMTAGSHLVEVRAEGYQSERREFIVEGGQPAEIAIRLERGADPDPAPLPEVTESEVVEGEPLPAEAVAAPPPSQPAEEIAPVEPVDDGGGGFEITTPTIIAGAATGALLVGTIITGAMALGANGDFDDAVSRSNDSALSPAERRQARADGEDAASRANTLSAVTDVLLVSTIVAAGATVALFFLTQPDEDEEAMADGPRIRGVSAVATPLGGAVLLTGEL